MAATASSTNCCSASRSVSSDAPGLDLLLQFGLAVPDVLRPALQGSAQVVRVIADLDGVVAAAQVAKGERRDEGRSEPDVENCVAMYEEAIAEMQIGAPAERNPKLAAFLEAVNADLQLKAWWYARR